MAESCETLGLICETSFENNSFPEGWFDEGRQCRFENGVLHSGTKCRPGFALPGNGYKKLRVEVTLDFGKAGVIDFGNCRRAMYIHPGSGIHRVLIQDGGTAAFNKQKVSNV